MPADVTDNSVGVAHDPSVVIPADEKHELDPKAHAVAPPAVVTGKAVQSNPGYFYDQGEADEDGHIGQQGDEWPTEDDLATLRRVPDKISLAAYTVAFIELCERFSYYGTQVLFTNFVQRPMPPGSTTGAGGANGQAGALNMGQRASSGIGTFNQFWIYTTPLFGAYIADTYWGRYKTICIALGVAITAHLLFIISALPPVLENPKGALGCFMVGIVVLGIGTGGFKPNVAALVVEQLPLTKMVVRKHPNGERVIHDPSLTASRVYMYFYLFVNIGALIGQLCMTYTEKYVGFWLAWLLPTAIFCICPAIMLWGRKKYKRTPPQGSVLGKALHIWIFAQKGRWHWSPMATWRHLHDGTMWESVKPSNIEPHLRPEWMTFDDAWVDEVRRGFSACAVYTWYPLFWLCYNQINNNLISQAATMQLHGLPNDIISNIDPLALVILIPAFDLGLYPLLRRWHINFTPIRRITAGFYCGCLAMIWATVLQYYIYKTNPCGKHANTCVDADGNPLVSPINIGAQTGAFVLIAVSEIFANVTALEYAYSKAPRNMRSLVQAISLFTNAFSSAIGEALVPLADDPLLIWNYGIPAILAVIGGTIFWIQFRGLDAEEDRLNNLPLGTVVLEGKERKLDEDREEERQVGNTIELDEEKRAL
ncbi:hypothetical protein V490_00738 [Pseudogymnoascus sp. VKM F-3557]|nr:hypothetical protein V490_00738 [Pseudogymnoascus sp. VKM F-3557]